MNTFTILITQCIPLLLLMALGYLAGKRFQLDGKTLADIVIFIISPVVMFGAVAKLPLEAKYFIIPLILFMLAATVTLGTVALLKPWDKDQIANLIGMSSATANTGYFGFPIILALFDADHAGLYLLITFALTLNESSFAYYVGARGVHSIRESFLKVLRLPTLYALVLGLAYNLSDLAIPEIFNTYWLKFAGAWTIIGMMLIGVALSRYELRINWLLLGSLTFTKFILWPAIALGLVTIDQNFTHLFDEGIYTMLLVLSSAPVAANVVAFATQLNIRPGEAALVVLISTLMSVLYMPFILWAFSAIAF